MESIQTTVHFRAGSEQLALMRLGDNLYRLEFSRLCAKHPSFGDVIECATLPDGDLKFRRIVKRANYQRLDFVISREVAESERLAQFLEGVMALGGNWERTFGGWLVLFLPESANREEVRAQFQQEVITAPN